MNVEAQVNLGVVPRMITLNSTVQIDGAVGGNGGGITKAGGGLLLLTNAANSYSGPTTVAGGILRPTVSGAIPAGANLNVGSSINLGTATLDLAADNVPLTVSTLTMGGISGASGSGWSLVNTGTAVLTLGGNSVTYATSGANAYGAVIAGNLALGLTSTTATFNIANSSGSEAMPDMTISANISGPAGVGLTKSGAGILLLSGNNSYSGTTAVSGGALLISGSNVTSGPTAITSGTLMARNAGALGGKANTGGVSLAAGQNFSYYPATDSPLAIGGNLVIASSGTVIGGAIGSTATSSAINVAGTATITGTSSVLVNVYGVSGAAPASGTYTLIQGGAGSALNSVTAPTLGKVYGNTNFTVGSLTASSTAVQLAVTSQPALTTAYWRGGLSGAPQVWAASQGTSGGASNWSTTSGGSSSTAQVLVPGPTTNVFFYAPAGGTADSASPNTTTLGADTSINSLTLDDFVNNALVLNADGYALTLGTGGISLLGGLQNQTVTINPNVNLNGAQTWTNNTPSFNLSGTNYSNNILLVNGNVNNNGYLLTVNAVAGQYVNIQGAISGSGGLTKTGGQILYLQDANTYTGPTTILGGTLQLQTYGAISQSSAVTLNNGASLLLVNANANDSLVNRVGNSAPFTVYGGSFQFDNSSGINLLYAQAIGPVALAGGQFDVILNNNQTCANNSQILTLGGLSQSGAAVVTFSAPAAGLNATTNVIQVGGATQTPAGQIIGPWATTGYNNGDQRDYAVYNAAGQIVPAGIAGSTPSTWTNPSHAYTLGTAIGTQTNATLSNTVTMAALRDNGNSDTLSLGAYNLQTSGILDGGSNNSFTINSTTGVVRQNGTNPANLYVTVGNNNSANVVINAPIVDNAGALTLVKSGYNPLYLNGANSYSGGLVLNAGTTYFNSVTAAGAGMLTFAGGSLDQNAQAALANAGNNPITINADFTFGAATNNALNLGTGAVSLGTSPGTLRTIYVNNAALLTLGGAIGNGTTANSLTKANGGTLVLGGNNTYSGATTVAGGNLVLAGSNAYAGGTTVSGGALTARNAGALGSGSLTLAANTTFNYSPTADAPLAVSGLSLSGASGTVILGGAIGGGTASAAINVSGLASVAAGNAVKLNIFGINGTTPVTGAYTLLQAAPGSTLSTGTGYGVNYVYNNTNFSIGTPSVSATAVTVPVTSATALTTAYWMGGLSGANRVWAASNGASASNWATASGGAVQALVPGPNTSVVFNGTGYSNSANPSTLART